MKRENAKEACEVLAWLAFIGGIIIGIYLAYKFGVDTKISSYSYKVISERNATKTITYFFAGFISGLVEFILFEAIAAILDYQAEILYRLNNNISVSVNTSETNLSTNSSKSDAELPPL